MVKSAGQSRPVPHLIERHQERLGAKRGGDKAQSKELICETIGFQPPDKLTIVPSAGHELRIPSGITKAAGETKAGDFLAGHHAGGAYDGDCAGRHAAHPVRRVNVPEPMADHNIGDLPRPARTGNRRRLPLPIGSMSSAHPHDLLATAVVPLAKASFTTSPHVSSSSLGNTRQSAAT